MSASPDPQKATYARRSKCEGSKTVLSLFERNFVA
jgi:hypothetical protein